MRKLVLVLATAVWTLAAPAQAATTTFAPTGPWAVDYADKACQLLRNFSSGDRQLTLHLQRVDPGPELALVIVGDSVPLATRARTVTYRYGPQGHEREGTLAAAPRFGGNTLAVGFAPLQDKFLAPPSEDGVPWASWTYEDERAAARAIDSVAVTGTFGDQVVLQLGAMEQPIAALQACVDELMNEWGVDARRLVAASRQAEPTTSPQTWLSKSDYPREMISQGRGGAVLLRLLVDAQGKATKCIAAASEAALGRGTCEKVMERAHFKPALDADGKPMTGLFVKQVRYVPVG